MSREGDFETFEAVHGVSIDGLRGVSVAEPGQVAAMTAGVKQAVGSVVAFVDDDAVPRPDWTTRLLEQLADPRVGAVGGRDVVHTDPDRRLMPVVGIVTKWGKVIGNHHLGVGPSRRVDTLKGVNMAFRREALVLPTGLRGSGAQVHNELVACLSAIRNGWQLVYDPSIIVDHFPGPRFDEDRRGVPSRLAVGDAAYNLVFSLLSVRSELIWRRVVYGLLMGDGGTPGLARALYALLRGDGGTVRRLLPSLAGQVRAIGDVARGRRVGAITFDSSGGAQDRLQPRR